MKTNKMYHSYKKLNQKSISSQIMDKYCMLIGPCPTPTMHHAHSKNALLHCLAYSSVNNQQNKSQIANMQHLHFTDWQMT